MTTHPIRLLGDPVLRSPAVAVTDFDAELAGVVRDLFDTLDAAPGRAGVAAPQIGVPVRVFVYGTNAGRGHVVNPQVTASSGTQVGDEGCLSVPGLAFPCSRPAAVTVSGFDERGEPVTVAGTGFLARALAHECDHLDGVLYLDGLTGDARRQALRAVRAGFRPRSR